MKIGKVVVYKRVRNNNKIFRSVILDISDINYFKFIFIPLFKNLDFHTNKYLDFCNWCYIVDLNYLGHHLTDNGKILIKEIKSIMNKERIKYNNSDFENIFKDMKKKITNYLKITGEIKDKT